MRISDWSSDVCSSDLRAESVRSGTQTIGEVMGAVGQAVGGIEEDTTEIAESAARIDQQCGGFVSTLEAMDGEVARSEEHTSELQSLMRISYAVFCLKKKKKKTHEQRHDKSSKYTTR